MYNNYAAEHAFWADTTNMDNLRGADATGKATPGAMEVSSTATAVTGFGNTRHSYSGDEIHSTKCTTSIGTTSAWYLVMTCSDWKASLDSGTNTYPEYLWISASCIVRRHVLNAGHTAWIYSNGGSNDGIISLSGVCNVFNFKTSGDDVLSSDGTMVFDPEQMTVQFYKEDGLKQGTANPYYSSTKWRSPGGLRLILAPRCGRAPRSLNSLLAYFLVSPIVRTFTLITEHARSITGAELTGSAGPAQPGYQT